MLKSNLIKMYLLLQNQELCNCNLYFENSRNDYVALHLP